MLIDKTPPQLALNFRRLRLRHLEILLAVEQNGSLSATADALGVSQPAVSQWIAEIESALGVQLFVRARQIQPTAYLLPVLNHARRMMADSKHLEQELQLIKSGGMGVVRIGTMQVASVGLIPNTLLALKSQSEPIRIDVVEDVANGLWARFERRELDLIVGRLDDRAFGAQVKSEALFKDAHRLVTGRSHPLLQERKISWAKAAKYPWILPTADTPLRRAIDLTFVDHGLAPPTPWFESVSSTVNQALMHASHCISVVSGAAAHHYKALGLLSVLALHLKSDVGPIGMVWDGERDSKALTRVLQALRDSSSSYQAEGDS